MSAPVPFTAVGASFLRAAHLTEDGNPKIFQDTLAHALVGRELATLFEDVLRQSWTPEILPVARVAMVRGHAIPRTACSSVTTHIPHPFGFDKHISPR